MTTQFKRYFMVIGIILILVFAVTFWLQQPSPNTATQIAAELNIQDTTPDITATDKTINFTSVTTPGQTIATRDFLADPDVVDWDGGVTYMLGAGTINEEEVYQLFYYAPDRSISIVLLQEPFKDIRLVAEEQLKTRLGISEQALCAMNIRVNVPQFASDTLSGTNLGLSFCPGSVQF